MTEQAATERRKPGPVPSLSREKVVATALEVLAREGARSVSFRTVALRLGVAPNALYTYVADKDDLISGMIDAIFVAVDIPRPGDRRSPDRQLIGMLASMRQVFIANAALFALSSTPAAANRWTLAYFDRIYAVLHAIEPDDRKAAALYVALIDVTVGSAMTTAREATTPTDVDELIRWIDPEEHPQVAAMTRAASGVNRDEVFERTLRTLLDAQR